MKTLSQYLFALVAVLLMTSCSTSKKVLNNGDKWIPSEFDAKNSILLVEAWSGIGKTKGITEQKKIMAEKYPFKYEVVSNAVINKREGKYADTKLYRWALVSTTISRQVFMGPGRGSQTTVDRDFNFYDRENKKAFKSTGRSQGSYKRTFPVVINTIAKYVAGK